MRIENTFTVALPVAEALDVLLDIERIAPCLPGAELHEVAGEEYRGVVKLRLGAMTTQFKGAMTLAEVDRDAGRIVMKAEGRDTRGQGNASATVTAVLTAAGDGTRVDIDTDVAITGKLAQFGRGVMTDVSKRLLGQFAACLEADLGGTTAPPPATAAPPPAAPAPPTTATVADSTGVAGNGSVRVVTPPRPAEPVDILRVAGGSMLERVVPAATVALFVAVAVARNPRLRWVLAALGAALAGAAARRQMQERA